VKNNKKKNNLRQWGAAIYRELAEGGHVRRLWELLRPRAPVALSVGR